MSAAPTPAAWPDAPPAPQHGAGEESQRPERPEIPEASEEPDEPLGAGPLEPVLYNVVYCSRAAAEADEAAVDHILQSARRRNPAWGITGLLVFGSGIFFQWLEGPRTSINALMARLRTDSRHHDIVLLGETEEVRERLFPDWDMERVGAEHIREVLVDAIEAATDKRNAAALEKLLAEVDAQQAALGTP